MDKERMNKQRVASKEVTSYERNTPLSYQTYTSDDGIGMYAC